MKLSKERFVVATIEYPLMFESTESSGEMTDELMESNLWEDETNCREYIGETYDEPENYRPMKITITYEF